MARITVISKKGCHICEVAISTLESLRKERPFELEVLDIEDDSVLFERYWIKVPVVKLDEKDVYEAEDIALPLDCKAKLANLVYSL
ncbi:MAG: glutaredoxin family protein [Nitrososphaerales archaeon]